MYRPGSPLLIKLLLIMPLLIKPLLIKPLRGSQLPSNCWAANPPRERWLTVSTT